VTLYVESSAVLAWLLGERAGAAVREALAGAEIVLTSELTLVECDRVLIRAVNRAGLSEAEAADRRARLNHAAAHWTLLALDAAVIERARRPFPREPIRTLDALHMASALVARAAVPNTTLLALDHRIRACAHQLGFALIPSSPPGGRPNPQ
jgi:predicted nucleic acid-binding protein